MSYIDDFDLTLSNMEGYLLRRQLKLAESALYSSSGQLDEGKKVQVELQMPWARSKASIETAIKRSGDARDFDELESMVHDKLDNQRFDGLNGGVEGVTFKDRNNRFDFYVWVVPESDKSEEEMLYAIEDEMDMVIRKALRRLPEVADMFFLDNSGSLQPFKNIRIM